MKNAIKKRTSRKSKYVFLERNDVQDTTTSNQFRIRREILQNLISKIDWSRINWTAY